MTLLSMIPRNSSMNLLRGYGSNKGKYVINPSLGETSKVYDPNQGKWLSRGILSGLA